MKNIEAKLSALVQSQFPSFYQENGDAFVLFVKAYYEWLDQGGSESRKLLEYRDIDYTVESFLKQFKNEFLNSLPETTATSKQFLVKHIQDLYKAKGSSEAYKLLFRLVFNEDIEVYDPSLDILKPSDGIWNIPTYLECSKSDRAFTFLGQKITGATSGSTGFVENIVRKRINGRFIDIIYLSNINGQFETGEYITDNNSLEGSPYIVGSLNEIFVTQGGAFNAIGDVMDISGSGGVRGKARVKAVSNGTGKVAYTLVDGGYGYQNTSTIITSNAVISISNANGTFYPFMTIVQPLQLYNHGGLSANSFSTTDIVSGYNNSNIVVANGYVVSVTSNATANTGNLVISVTGGDWNLANTVRLATNSSVNATVSSTSNISAIATVVDSNSTAVGIYSNTRAFYNKGYVKAYIGEPIGLVNIASTSTTAILGTGNNHFDAEVSVGDTLYFRANGTVIGVVNSVTSNTGLTLVANASYAVSNSTIWRTNYKVTANADRVYSSGSGTTFNIGALSSTETIIVDTDLLYANNSGSKPFLDMLINGTNSNVASNAYGFPANTGLGYNSIIAGALTTNTITVGTIKSLSAINPGNNYNVDPLIVIRESLVAGYDRPDLYINLANTNSLFAPGQTLTQDGIITKSVLSVSSNTGAFIQNEGVTQLTSLATGTIYSANSTTLVINIVSGSFVTANNVVGNISGANAVISAITSSTSQSRAKATIRSISGNTILAESASFNFDFVSSANVYSTDNNDAVQGLGYISDISRDYTHRTMGFDADVNTAVTAANGIVTEVEVISSGFGYSNGISLTLTNTTNSQLQIFGTGIDMKNGKDEGFWKDNRGKLNSDKYIHDNKYYQEYSYEIRSRLSLNVYSDILKKLLHIAGTELFGKTIIQTQEDITLQTPGVKIEIS